MKTIVLFFAILSPVFGRIGETTKECQKRYDCDKLPTPNGELSRIKGDLRIRAKFRDGKCVGMIYSKTENDFSDEEMMKLLGSNHPGKWHQIEIENPMIKVLESDDKSLRFIYMHKDKMIICITTAELAARDKEELEASKRSMEGL